MVDPYDWLGVPKGPRPPTHYQLLGLDHVVTEPAAIRAAADRQMRRLLPHLTGPDALAAEQAWIELEEARDTLLDPTRRAHYDATVPLTGSIGSTDPVAATEPAAPDISAFEEPPPPPTATAGGAQPWWAAAPAPVAASPDAWWKQPLPDEPAPPPTATAATATKVYTSTVSMPTAAPASSGPIADWRPLPVAQKPNSPPERQRKKTSPAVVVIGGLLVAGLIAGGMYYAFGRKANSPTTPTPEPELAKDRPKTDPKPKASEEPKPKVEEPIIAEVPLPKDFADQLRPRTYNGHSGAVNWIAIAKSGSRFATAGTDRTLRLWAIAKDASMARHTFTAPAVGVAWADRDRKLVAADGFVVAMFDPLKTNPPRVFESPKSGVTALAVTPDGLRALNGLSDGYLRLWDTTAGRSDEWPAAARGPVTAVDISSDGRALAALQDGPVSLWELNSRNKVHEWNPHPGGAIAVQFSPNGKLAATAGPDGFAAVYDLAGKREVCRLAGHTGPVTGIAWQASGRQLATVGVDGTARLWNAETGQPIRWVQTLNGKGTCVAVDPGDRFVLVGTSTGTVHLFPLPRVKGEALAGNVGKPPADPLAIPDTEAAATAIAAVRIELLKEYAFTRADDVSILADNLRRRAALENAAPPLRYGLLQEARTLAVKAGDPGTAFRAVEDLALWFDVDELAEKASTLAAFPADADPIAIVSAGLATGERAETDARPELVERLLVKLGDPAGLPPDLSARLTALRQRSTAAAKEMQTVRRALDLLKNAPDEQGANQTVGLFLCLARQDWAAGLPYLARGTDPRLIDAAKADLGNPTDPKAQHRLGESWFAFGTDARDHRAKRAYLGRARTWFERESKAKLDVTDSIKSKARLDDVAKLDVPSKDPTTLPLFSPVVVRRAYNTVGPEALANQWRLDGGADGKPEGVTLPGGEPSLHSNFGLAPGSKLTLSFRPDGREIRLNVAGQEVAFAAAGKTLRIAIERKEAAVTLTGVGDMGDEGELVVRNLDLPVVVRGPTHVTVRLTGTPTRPGGAMLTAAIARGPASLPPPTPE